MRSLDEFKVIIWDFDGVLLDSMHIRDQGFLHVLSEYSSDQLQQLMTYHRANGGLSRYVKFRYFYEQVLNRPVDDETIQRLANEFSAIMLKLLIDESLIIRDSLEFVVSHHQRKEMHIVSGSDGVELKQICKALNMDQYFKSIHGSPTPKKENVSNLLKDYRYNAKDVILIGDSVNDYEAARHNRISFAGYNNLALAENGEFYIHSFGTLNDMKHP